MKQNVFEYTYGNGVTCAECGTDITWWVYEKNRQAYCLSNQDIVCSKKCFKEYAESYFNIGKIKIKKGGE
jgi:hypothetical protein